MRLFGVFQCELLGVTGVVVQVLAVVDVAGLLLALLGLNKSWLIQISPHLRPVLF